MREGKNREIRNVLGALGLQVNRLIRVSYGPFQLGDLPPGATEEIPTRALREQIGERLAAISGADFSAPITNVVPPLQGKVGERSEPGWGRKASNVAPPTRSLSANTVPQRGRDKRSRPPHDDGDRKRRYHGSRKR
jgi:23S rRNA pseudouridine2605 synthase